MIKLQLTKDDIEIYEDVFSPKRKKKQYLDFSKFLKVRKFYEKYKLGALLLDREQPEIAKKLYSEMEKSTMSKIEYQDWLFNYCFRDGLKSDKMSK